MRATDLNKKQVVLCYREYNDASDEVLSSMITVPFSKFRAFAERSFESDFDSIESYRILHKSYDKWMMRLLWDLEKKYSGCNLVQSLILHDYVLFSLPQEFNQRLWQDNEIVGGFITVADSENDPKITEYYKQLDQWHKDKRKEWKDYGYGQK